MFIQKFTAGLHFPRNSVATGVIGHCRGLLMACFLRLCLSQRMGGWWKNSLIEM